MPGLKIFIDTRPGRVIQYFNKCLRRHEAAQGGEKMKRIAFLALLFLAISVCAASAAELTFDFQAPVIVKGATYDDISMGGLPVSYEPMMPILPFRPVQIILPQGTTAEDIRAVTAAPVEVKGNFFLRPAGYNVPLSMEKQSAERKKRAMLENGGKTPAFVYKISGPYPASALSNFSVQRGRGYVILVVNVHPVFYQAEARKVYYYPKITVSYRLSANVLMDKMNEVCVREMDSDREYVAGLVDNPEAVKSYAAKKMKGEKVDYLIVSSRKLLAAEGQYSFKVFAGFLGKKGLVVRTAAVEDILAATRGSDNADKLRNHIRKMYNENGLRYVLLGGGGLSKAPVIPVRKLHADFKWDSDTFNQELPADVYYSHLDGSFDANGNGVYGEPKDGEGGTDIDMISEVSVGRAPAETPADVENFVRKTMAAYSYAESAEFGRVLFSGESLFPGIYGSSYMAEIENGATVHGFATAGYPKYFPRQNLQDAPSKSWSGSDMIAAINSGYAIINHIGHSNVTSNMRLSSWSMSSLKNTKYYLLYSQGCYCGRFTDSGCIMVAHVNSPCGAYAVIGNSSYGLGPEDPDPDTGVACRGASQYFHRQFTNALFAAGKDRLGDANAASKEANIKFMGHGTTRWVFFELNLFGDPYLPIKVK